MARMKKVADGLDEGLESEGFDDLAAALEATLGASQGDKEDSVPAWLSTGYAPLDWAISGMKEGGGMPVGRLIEVAGNSAAGKTSLATQLMISAQKRGDPAVFFDYERSFSLELARDLGLKTTPGLFSLQRPRTFEDGVAAFSKAAEAIHKLKGKKDRCSVFIFDSLSAMIPMSQLAKDATAQTMADQTALARATSLHMKTIALLASECNACVVFLNQLRMKPGVAFGDPTYTSGGEAPKFYASVRVTLSASKITEGAGDDKEMVGNYVVARVVKNKVARPFRKARWAFRFHEDGSGYLDTAGSLLDILIDNDVIQKTGKGRIEWIDGSKPFRRELVEGLSNPEGIALLEGMWRDIGAKLDEVESEPEDEEAA